jgi:hypothetical protein
MKIIQTWYEGLIYPLKEKDWKSKMWLIPVIGVVLTPFIQLLVLRGWRVDLVRNIGVRATNILPKADLRSVARYAIHGIKLYAITALYLVVALIVLRIFGINPIRQLWIEIVNLFSYFFNNTTGLSLGTLLWQSFWRIAKEIFINNAWVLFYYPYYRTATIRYALTGKFKESHLAFAQNAKFVIRNVMDFVNLLINQFVDKFILFFVNVIVNVVLTPFIGYVLAPLIFFFADFWTSGYEHGQIAKKMVDQEYPEMLNQPNPPANPQPQQNEFV